MMVGSPSGRLLAAPDPTRKLRVAAIVTEFTYRSHAHVILENFLEPYLFNGKKTDSGMEVVSLYVDQFPRGDMARDVAEKYGIKIYPTIAEALRVGGDRLAVDAVLSIGEHGKYPNNAKSAGGISPQAILRRDRGRVPPERGDGAGVQRQASVVSGRLGARDGRHGPEDGLRADGGELGPAGDAPTSLELPPGARITEAVSLHGGNLEGYDFHGLEVLQSMVESRCRGRDRDQGGGVLRWRPALEGGRRGPSGRPSWPISPGRPIPTPQGPARCASSLQSGRLNRVHGILVTYKDGLRGMVLNAARDGTHWHFACKLAGDPTPEGDELLRRPLGQPQPVQGALARDPDVLPRAPAAVPGRADAPDDVAHSTRPWSPASRDRSR